MRDQPPTWRDVVTVGVLPTVAALLVTAVLLIERVQTDWSLSHSIHVPASRAGLGFAPWFLPLFAFAVCQIAFGGGVFERTKTAVGYVGRWTRALAFAGFFMLPAFAGPITWTGFIVGLLAAMTIIGFWVIPIVSPAAAGGVFGVALSLGLRPMSDTLTDPNGHKFVWRVCKASMLAGIVVFLTQLAVDVGTSGTFMPRLANALLVTAPSLGLMLGLAAVTIACCLIWYAVLASTWPSGDSFSLQVVRRGFAVSALAAIAIGIVAITTVSCRVTVFGPTASSPIGSWLRQGNPRLHDPKIVVWPTKPGQAKPSGSKR
jgi:MFS family permease